GFGDRLELDTYGSLIEWRQIYAGYQATEGVPGTFHFIVCNIDKFIRAGRPQASAGPTRFFRIEQISLLDQDKSIQSVCPEIWFCTDEMLIVDQKCIQSGTI